MSAPLGAGDAELLAAVEAVTATLGQFGVPYFITGSFASSVQGVYRATNDVDIVADLAHADLEALFERLSAEFVADSALASRVGFNLIHKRTYLKVDVFPCLTAFEYEATRRAEPISLGQAGSTLRVATREDILLAKLRWYRQGGEQSEVQRRDIQGLVALNRGEMDVEYMRRWASTLAVDDLLSHYLA